MVFESPFALLGLAVVGVPVAIHLLNLMQVRHVKWAAMRFLQKASQKNERRMRIEDLLLLLARCLLVLLLVLAFARPVLNPDGGSQANTGVAGVSVVVLDQSASMGSSDGVRTRLETAKQLAGEYIASLPVGSNVALIKANSRSAGVDAAPGPELGRIRREIDAAVPSGSANDWPSAIRKAIDALKPYEQMERTVVIFTDCQASAWSRQEEVRTILAQNPGVSIRIVQVGAALEENLAIISLKPDSGIVSVNNPAVYRVEVRNYGKSPAENIRVTLEMDAGPPAEEKMIPRIEAGDTVSMRLALRISTPGIHTITARIPQDRMPLDDSRSIACKVASDMRVAIVGESVSDPGVRFLSNALVPLEPSKRENHFLKVQFHQPSWLDEARLERETAIILLNPEKLSRTSTPALRKYVEQGGALMVFPGGSGDTLALAPDFAEMLPANLKTVRDAGAEPMNWQADSYPHPVTGIWNGSPENSLGGVIEQRNFPLTLRDSSARSVVNYANGSPAVVEGSLGDGRVVVFAAPPDARWTNLPLHPNFLPFLQRLLAEMISSQSGGRFLAEPGEGFQMPMKQTAVGRNLVVQSPSTPGMRPAGQVLAAGDGGILRFRDTFEPGAYRLFFEGSDQPVAAFAVQVPQAESEIALIDGGALNFAQTMKMSSQSLEGAPKSPRVDFFSPLLWLALVVAIMELIMAHRFSFSK